MLQTCLSNQLKDLYQSDLQRTSEGKVPLYLMSQYTYGLSSAMKRTGDGGISFALPVPFKRSSIVVLETTADTLQFVTNVSPGNLSGRSRTLASSCSLTGDIYHTRRQTANHNDKMDSCFFQGHSSTQACTALDANKLLLS